MATIDIWLFGKPEWEMDLDNVTSQDIRYIADSLRTRLYRKAEIIEKLENNEWSIDGAGLYNIYIYKDIKKELVLQELKNLGIEEKEVNIEDFEEDGEDSSSSEEITIG